MAVASSPKKNEAGLVPCHRFFLGTSVNELKIPVAGSFREHREYLLALAKTKHVGLGREDHRLLGQFPQLQGCEETNDHGLPI